MSQRRTFTSKRQAEAQHPPPDKRQVSRNLPLSKFPHGHRFRASGASVMDNSGALLPGIQRILGHADRRSTEIYLEKLRDVERDAMDVYERESRKDDDKVADNFTHAVHTHRQDGLRAPAYKTLKTKGKTG
ncbi:tyrosine-type recombinase/integrase [Pseudodesulfovibrio karagichevae]|uniref:Tyrosine-type recombinase/integrase n=1 Tax=Pseudodesulfovibrio karagichevae TaxID=3239305 RepID=A0ABV4K6E7_9BACT